MKLAPVPRPSKWVSASGKVHRRRIRFWPGQPYEKFTDEQVITLCGRGRNAGDLLRPAPKGAIVDCGVCLRASNTKGHLR